MKEECPVWSVLLLERVDVRLSTHASTYLSAFLVVYRAPSLAPAHLTSQADTAHAPVRPRC